MIFAMINNKSGNMKNIYIKECLKVEFNYNYIFQYAFLLELLYSSTLQDN